MQLAKDEQIEYNSKTKIEKLQDEVEQHDFNIDEIEVVRDVNNNTNYNSNQFNRCQGSLNRGNNTYRNR